MVATQREDLWPERNCQAIVHRLVDEGVTSLDEVNRVLVDDEGRHLIQVDVKMASQLGVTMATAKAEIQLPKK